MSDPTPQSAGNPTQLPEPPSQPLPATGAATLTQEQFNTALAEERRKWKRQQDETAEKVRKAAEDQAAQEKGEFEKLATDRATRITQLEAEHTTAQEQLTAYREEMERQIKARLRTLPEEIRAMAPEGDALTRYTWLEKAETAAAKLTDQRPLGTPAGPQGNGTRAHGGAAPDLAAKKRASGDYTI